MRESVAAIAVIRQECEGQTFWLAQWNKKWQRFHFVGGHKRPNETFRECVVREIEEELVLARDHDFSVSAQPLAHIDYAAWSESAGEKTHYVMELFDVRLPNNSVQKANSDPSNRWLTPTEIKNRRAFDGRPVSDTMQLILNEAGLLSSDVE